MRKLCSAAYGRNIGDRDAMQCCCVSAPCERARQVNKHKLSHVNSNEKRVKIEVKYPIIYRFRLVYAQPVPQKKSTVCVHLPRVLLSYLYFRVLLHWRYLFSTLPFLVTAFSKANVFSSHALNPAPTASVIMDIPGQPNNT